MTVVTAVTPAPHQRADLEALLARLRDNMSKNEALLAEATLLCERSRALYAESEALCARIARETGGPVADAAAANCSGR